MTANIALLTDHPGVVVETRPLLEDNGFSVRTYDDLVDLFHGIIPWTPDVIILDLSVWTVREQAMTIILRERAAMAKTLFVLITTLTELRHNKPEAVDAVLIRPYLGRDLLELLN